MKILKITKGTSEVALNMNELCTLNNALNEVCNGIVLEGEFETRIGVKLEEASAILASIQNIIRDVAREE